jgi:hypothetical protein
MTQHSNRRFRHIPTNPVSGKDGDVQGFRLACQIQLGHGQIGIGDSE